MIEEPAGLPAGHALPESQVMLDFAALQALEINWSPEWRFKLDYVGTRSVWTATPDGGGEPLEAPSAAELRSKLRRALPADRAPRHG